jgi:putative ATPase
MPTPLAQTLRPTRLAGFIGQEKLVGSHGPISQMLASGQLASMVFWGPPASGKTTLAHIISQEIEADFYTISAVMDGKEALKKILDEVQSEALDKKPISILFIDEIHRWNKAQQDALLPYVENGTIVLIGATTENPSFSINNALLSRTRVFVFEPHTVENITEALARGAKILGIKLDKSLPTSAMETCGLLSIRWK